MRVILGRLLRKLEDELGATDELSEEATTEGLENLLRLEALLAASKLLRGLMPEVNLGKLASSGSEVLCFSGWDESSSGREAEGTISST